jgi:hypothetical protein
MAANSPATVRIIRIAVRMNLDERPGKIFEAVVRIRISLRGIIVYCCSGKIIGRVPEGQLTNMSGEGPKGGLALIN